jgi:hypothetical protein
MGIRDVPVVYPAKLPRSFASVRKSNGGKKMTTENMEAWSLEEGDQIVIMDNVYRITKTDLTFDRKYFFWLVDEEGQQKTLAVEGYERLPLLIDNFSQV